jgi:ribosome-binding protein aMBF1 (putative translation factor)
MAKKPQGRAKKTKRKTPAKSQATRFKEAARAIDADESGKTFDRSFKVIVRTARSDKGS